MTAGRNPGAAGPGESPLQGDRSIAQVAGEAMAMPPSQRAYVFVQSLGGVWNGRTLTNRDAVVATMVERIETFARFYIQVYDRTATPLLPQAARDVADRFMDQLVRDAASGPISIGRTHVGRMEPRLPEVEGPQPQALPLGAR